jgi:CheY-like chemotaxis protein
MAEVLLIEDDANMSLALKERLEADGHSVRMVNDAEKGLAMMREKLPQVLLVDRWLPGMTGIEMLDALTQDPKLAKAKVAITILTNLEDPEVAADMKKRGYGYLVKADVSLDELAGYVGSQV